MLTKIQVAVLNISMFAYGLEFESAYKAVPLRRRQKIDQLKNEKDKIRSLAAELVLNYCLMEYENKKNVETDHMKNNICKLFFETEDCMKNNVSREKVKNIMIKNLSENDIKKSITNEKAFLYEIEYQYGGKPILAGINPIFFNLSHSGDYAVCIVSNTPVGIDIEGKHKINEKVMKKCFSEKEKNWVNENTEEKKERFFRLWTAKEAVSKATGKGLSQIIEGIYFQVENKLTLENECLKNIYSIYEIDSLRNEEYCITAAVKQ